jgi:hypothetical protein
MQQLTSVDHQALVVLAFPPGLVPVPSLGKEIGFLYDGQGLFKRLQTGFIRSLL